MSLFSKEMGLKAKEIHQTAVDKGWWEGQVDPLNKIMLMVSELAEACEEIRNGKPPTYQLRKLVDGGEEDILPTDDLRWHPRAKPEGTLIELADTVIRIMDFCEKNGWDLGEAIEMKMAYNKTRSYRHGGKLA